jgi:hypothetical protein
VTKKKTKSTIVLFGNPEEAASAEESAKAVGFEVSTRKIEFASIDEIVIRWARVGDWDVLADYILGGNRITAEMRDFLGAILRQQVKRPNNRARTLKNLSAIINRVQFFLSLPDYETQRENAVTQTAEKFGVDRRTVQRNLEECEDAVKLLLLAKHASAQHRCVPVRYTVSAGALSQHFMS